ncbi:MAG: GTP-binding protein [Promethearchaeota archaeon]
MAGEKDQRRLKLVVIGDTGVGKTSLIRRFVEGWFSESYVMTIGANFFSKTVQAGDTTINLLIWDMMGQERFKFMASSYFKGTDGALVLFDLTHATTFKPSIFNWLDMMFKYTGRIPIILIGNKVDLVYLQEVRTEDAEEFAAKLMCSYVETSAKSGYNVDEAFQKLVTIILEGEGIQEKFELIQEKEIQLTTAPVREEIKTDNKWGVKSAQAEILAELENIINQDIPRVNKLRGKIIGAMVEKDDLVGLALYNCGLKIAPESICQLLSLKYLDLSRNQLKELPKSFGHLTSLQELDLSNNQLKSLPENFGNLQLIINLNLYFNQLEALPNSFKDMKSLEILNLSYNQLTSFPEVILNLKSLQFIGLRSNQLTELPMGLWHLNNLEDIQLGGNPWKGDWKEIVKNDVPTIFDYCRKHDNITIFCSHAEADFHSHLIEIEKIARLLSEQEEIYKVYYSEEAIQGGMNFEEFMRKYVPISHVLIFFATKNSLKSKPCQFELQIALDNQIPIIPILGPHLGWSDLNQVALLEPTGEHFQLAEVKGLPYLDNISVFSAELYKHIYDLKRTINLFDKEQIQIDQFKLEFAEFFTDFIKSNTYNIFIKENFNKIRTIFMKFKQGSISFPMLVKKLFEILD